MLDEQGLKPISVLKDDPGFAKLNWFSLFRLKTPLEKFSSRNEGTHTTPEEDHGDQTLPLHMRPGASPLLLPELLPLSSKVMLPLS